VEYRQSASNGCLNGLASNRELTDAGSPWFECHSVCCQKFKSNP
jgi:hypothetical protein